MRPTRMIRCVLPLYVIVMIAFATTPAHAQVQEVVVGVTMNCPYENAIEGSCWSGAYWALMQLDGVKSVDKAANGYTCTARVYLKDKSVPDPEKWAAQFKKLVDQTYTFRGVEVTVEGIVGGGNYGLDLHVSGVERPLSLQPLKHKLQWNAKKGVARQPEPDESDAYKQLAANLKDAKGGELKARVTGRLMKSDTGYNLEVREFFPVAR